MASLANSRLCPGHAAMHITPAEVNARSVLQDCSSGALYHCKTVVGTMTIMSSTLYCHGKVIMAWLAVRAL